MFFYFSTESVGLENGQMREAQAGVVARNELGIQSYREEECRGYSGYLTVVYSPSGFLEWIWYVQRASKPVHYSIASGPKSGTFIL